MFAVTNGVRWQDSDIVNPDEYDTARGTARTPHNPHGMKLWLVHDAGFVVGLAFASCEQDAFDELADAGKLDFCQVKDDEHPPESEEWNRYAYLGNASEVFNIDTLDMFAVEVPKLSVAALYNAGLVEDKIRDLAKSVGLMPDAPADILADKLDDDGKATHVLRAMFTRMR